MHFLHLVCQKLTRKEKRKKKFCSFKSICINIKFDISVFSKVVKILTRHVLVNPIPNMVSWANQTVILDPVHLFIFFMICWLMKNCSSAIDAAPPAVVVVVVEWLTLVPAWHPLMRLCAALWQCCKHKHKRFWSGDERVASSLASIGSTRKRATKEGKPSFTLLRRGNGVATTQTLRRPWASEALRLCNALPCNSLSSH